MILQALVSYYEKLAEQDKVSCPGWCSAKVSYGIQLSCDGEIKGITWLKQEVQRGKKTVEVPSSMKVPEMLTRSSGVAANFLCDNSKYLLGIDRETDEKSKKRARECFEAAREKHLTLLKDTKGKMATAVRNFFLKWDPERAFENPVIKENMEELTEGGNLIFRMGIENAQDDPEIKECWESILEDSDLTMRKICLVTGKNDEIARIHRTIKGVPGAQSSGAALVSFNAPSFESYGKEQSYNAPVGTYAEFAYTTALNYLLSQREYAIPIGDTMVMFWAEDGKQESQDIFKMSVDPPKDNQEELKDLFKK